MLWRGLGGCRLDGGSCATVREAVSGAGAGAMDGGEVCVTHTPEAYSAMRTTGFVLLAGGDEADDG